METHLTEYIGLLIFMETHHIGTYWIANIVLWYYGIIWYYGIMVSWYYGIMVLYCIIWYYIVLLYYGIIWYYGTI